MDVDIFGILRYVDHLGGGGAVVGSAPEEICSGDGPPVLVFTDPAGIPVRDRDHAIAHGPFVVHARVTVRANVVRAHLNGAIHDRRDVGVVANNLISPAI